MDDGDLCTQGHTGGMNVVGGNVMDVQRIGHQHASDVGSGLFFSGLLSFFLAEGNASLEQLID